MKSAGMNTFPELRPFYFWAIPMLVLIAACAFMLEGCSYQLFERFAWGADLCKPYNSKTPRWLLHLISAFVLFCFWGWYRTHLWLKVCKGIIAKGLDTEISNICIQKRVWTDSTEYFFTWPPNQKVYQFTYVHYPREWLNESQVVEGFFNDHRELIYVKSQSFQGFVKEQSPLRRSSKK